MLLYILTSENGDREDCSVFYSTFLGVKGKDEAAVEAAFKKVLGVKDIKAPIPTPAGSKAEKLLGERTPGKLIKALKAEGVKAKEIYPSGYIVDSNL